MFWLFLLGAVTALLIALRRVLHRQKPLDDELYSKKIAIDHIHSGVAWVRADGTLGSLNPSLAGAFGAKHGELDGRDWLKLFPLRERERIEECYRQALLAGMKSFETSIERLDGSVAHLDVLLLSVHDHKMRFVGHHLLTSDRTRERVLAEEVRALGEALARLEARLAPTTSDPANV